MVLWVKLCSCVDSPLRASSISVSISSAPSSWPVTTVSSPRITAPSCTRTVLPSRSLLKTSAPTSPTITTPERASSSGPRFG